MNFKKNDIIRLRNEYFDKIKSKLFFPQNIFFIDKFLDDGEFVLLRNVDITVPSSEIRPVKIDGEEDRFIYYDPVIAADVVRPDEAIKCRHVDRDEYYLQKMKTCFDSKGQSYYNILNEEHFVYVHELQHSKPFISRDLRINYKLTPFIKPLPFKMKLETGAMVMTYRKYLDTQHEWDNFIKVYIEKEICQSKMVATSICTEKTAYVLLFENDNHFDAKYAEFYINSSMGKLFLLNKTTNGKLEGNVTIANLRKLVIRWVNIYKECCVYLECLTQVIYVYENRLGKDISALTGLLSFLSQVRDAMVMEMIIPDLFKRANFSILKKWKQDTDAIMLDFYLAEDASDKQIELIGKLIKAIGSNNDGIVNEMAKYRIYMLEFMRFAERNKTDL
ncbi:hypothetical protein [uncultured Prevotella sp.]|uniref:hypothetical protein n=1 Tax=uncultured Prevotella sp. TaxID=159272 RepID=UPI0025ED262C|nr:hypothetical protein [uncultured Prevotella sp.]